MKLPFQVELGIAPRLRCWPASGFFAADDTEHAEPTIKALLGTMSPAFFAQSWLLGGAVPVSGYDVIIILLTMFTGAPYLTVWGLQSHGHINLSLTALAKGFSAQTRFQRRFRERFRCGGSGGCSEASGIPVVEILVQVPGWLRVVAEVCRSSGVGSG